MNISKIESNLRQVVGDFSGDNFIYELLGAYGKPKASIARLQKGHLNRSERDGEIIWKKNLNFKRVGRGDLYSTFELVCKDKEIYRYSPRFLIVSDNQTLLAIDTANFVE